MSIPLEHALTSSSAVGSSPAYIERSPALQAIQAHPASTWEIRVGAVLLFAVLHDPFWQAYAAHFMPDVLTSSVTMDPSQLRQAQVNCLQSAASFPPGVIIIINMLLNKTHHSSACLLSVQDTQLLHRGLQWKRQVKVRELAAHRIPQLLTMQLT
jgi:hypothetical protein